MANLDSNGFEIIPNTLVEGYHSGWLENYGRVARPVSVNSTIQYRTVNVTAVAGLDYKPVSGTLVYPKGSTVAISPVPRIDIIDDNISEGEETFKYEFFNPQGSISSITYTLIISDTLRSPQAQSLEVWSNVENLTLTGSANVNGTGNQKSNTLRGNAGNNILDGKEGNDLLIGDGGADTLIGGAGNDTYQIAPLNAAGSRIRDVSGTNDVLTISGIVEKRLTSGQVGFGRDGTTLIIDLDKDGKVNLIKDLSVENFFSTGTSWKAGTGFIEKIGSLSGNQVLNLFGLEAEETAKIGEVEKSFKLNLVGFPVGSNRDKILQGWTGEEVWIVIHGWKGISPNIETLARTVASKKTNASVLTLDWKAAITPGIIDFAIGNGTAAKWINPTAKLVADKLKAWGLNDITKINLVGHSLGTLMSGRIAAEMGGVQTITALEPPSERNLIGGYDLDGSRSGQQSVKNTYANGGFEGFSRFSTFSRAFVGSRSVAGNTDFAATAHQAILTEFSSGGPTFSEEHDRVITVFNNLVAGSRPLVGNLLDLNDMRVRSEFRPDSYERNINVEPGNLISDKWRIYDGFFKVNKNNLPVSFTGTKPSTALTRDEIILGTNWSDGGSDGREPVLDGTPITPLVGGFGNDTLTGGSGADNFVFDINKSFNASEMGVDTITDFVMNTDRIVLDKTTFTALSTTAGSTLSSSEFSTISTSAANGASSAASSGAKIVFNSTTGDLFYNQNGVMSDLGSGGSFAVLSGVTSLSAGSFAVRA